MIDSSHKSPFSRFSKPIAGIVGAVGCAFLVGAAQPRPVDAPAKQTETKSVDLAPQAELSTELLHETTSTVAPEPAIVSHKKIVKLLVTAYCGCPKCCGSHARGLTASGRSIGYNGGEFVAADTRLFKFGTQLQIPGYANGQPVEVIDKGGAIKGNHIDVFFRSHDQAKAWGKRMIEVTVLDEVAPMN
jgi:3D (Asp-Asp-Asp) domain-containing protein